MFGMSGNRAILLRESRALPGFVKPVYIHNVKPTEDDLKRYVEHFLRQQDCIALYLALARAEKDPARSEIFARLAKAEERHAARWARLLRSNSAPVPVYSPSWRVLALGWLSRRFGTQHVLPV